jgi:hypothetical protein
MKRHIPVVALATIALTLVTTSKSQAWGGINTGYGRVGYSGVTYVGYPGGYAAPYVGYGSYGSINGYRPGSSSAYRPGSVGVYRNYAPSYTPGYSVGGYHYDYGVSPYGTAGYYRGW